MHYAVKGEHTSFSIIRTLRHWAVTFFGWFVLIIGIIMIVAPGPAFVFVPLGLAILGTEYIWARRWLKIAKHEFAGVNKRVKSLLG